MPSINDWAAKCADRIDDEYPHARGKQHPSIDRIAAIIATFAEPLMNLLRESKREHYHCEDSWYCCGKCDHDCHYRGAEDHEHDEDCYPNTHDGEGARTNGVCNCGADAWNARVDAVLDGVKP